MARLLILDSQATQDSNGNALDQNMWSGTRRTQPVRLYGSPEGDSRYVGFEFVLSGTAGNVDIYWFQEYYSDGPSATSPVLRTFPSSGYNYPWAREQSSEPNGSGVFVHYNVTREILSMNSGGNADCRWFPMTAFGLFVRLAVWTPSAPPSPNPRLQIFAHVGGYASQQTIEAGSYPYVE